MRALFIALVLGAASLASAQAPAAPTAPAGAAPRSGGGEFRVGGFLVNGDRAYQFFNNFSSETGSIQGVDVLLRAKAIGIGVRSLTGTWGDQPHVTRADARIYLFPPVFSLVVGAGRRALWSDLNADSPSSYDIGIAGISSTVSIGGSGLRTNIAAAALLPAGESSDKIKGGLEGEASMIYRIPKLPFYIQAGYFTEVFTAKGTNFETPEVLRGVRVGGGLLLGGQ